MGLGFGLEGRAVFSSFAGAGFDSRILSGGAFAQRRQRLRAWADTGSVITSPQT
jgi:hypothetical protein